MELIIRKKLKYNIIFYGFKLSPSEIEYIPKYWTYDLHEECSVMIYNFIQKKIIDQHLYDWDILAHLPNDLLSNILSRIKDDFILLPSLSSNGKDFFPTITSVMLDSFSISLDDESENFNYKMSKRYVLYKNIITSIRIFNKLNTT